MVAGHRNERSEPRVSALPGHKYVCVRACRQEKGLGLTTRRPRRLRRLHTSEVFAPADTEGRSARPRENTAPPAPSPPPHTGLGCASAHPDGR
jgi:hypothetical protein